VSDEKLWDESPTSRHLQVLYHQTSFMINPPEQPINDEVRIEPHIASTGVQLY